MPILGPSYDELTFRDILPLLIGRTITGYGNGAIGDVISGLVLTFDDGSWAQLTLRRGHGMRLDIYNGSGDRLFSDWRTGEAAVIPPGIDPQRPIIEVRKQ